MTALRRFPVGIAVLARLGKVFRRVDKEPDIRQLHEIAELGKPKDEPTNTPEFMQLQMTSAQPRIEERDFRDEVYAHIYDRGDPEPKRTLRFDILVADEGRTVRSTNAYKRVKVEKWEKLGEIVFDSAVASYSGDHVIHFHHPVWRDDRNDPSTAVRAGGKRVDR